MKKYDLLLADADGTVLDFSQAEDKALAAACAAMGIDIDAAQAARYKAINEALWKAFERREVTQEALRLLRFSRFFEEIGVEADAEVMAEQFVKFLGQQTDEIDGAYAFLQAASARVPVVIITNGIAEVQRSRFALSRLRAFISGHVISGEMGFAKPDPRMVERALQIGGVSGGRALMLGDSLTSDIGAAEAAGIDSCWYNPEGLPNDTPRRPTFEVRMLDEVLQWL